MKPQIKSSLDGNQLRLILESAGVAIFGLDINGNHTFINPKANSLLGYEQDELIGRNSHSMLSHHLPDGSPFPVEECPIYFTLKDGKTHNGEGYLWRKDGSGFYVDFTSMPIFDNDSVIGAVVTFLDITDRKKRDLESMVNYEITQGITSTSNLDELLKLIHHSLGKAVYAENCFVALYDAETGLFSFPYFVDKIDTVFSPTSMRKSCTAYVFRTGKPLLLTQELFDKLNEQNEVELVGTNSPSWVGVPLQIPSRIIGVLVLQHYEKENVYSESDVRILSSIGNQIAVVIDRKKAEEEIKLKNELLNVLNTEKDKFFSILAHDLRGPLSSFVAATQILTEDIQTMTLEDIRDFTVSMSNSANNIYSLLENLLEWSMLQRGVINFNPEKFYLNTRITETIKILNQAAQKKDLKINNDIPEDLEIIADIHMIETVLRNLVSNAVKFTPQGGKIFISASITVNKAVEIRIRDTGIGMKPELLNKLFLLNQYISRKGTEGEPSSGLGLLLCKDFIEKHKGKIRAESEDGKGSVFIFTIPQSWTSS
ncbi:MAG TPA: ATP-binding protein [Bacteroidales bacterium]|nr:ATP-binding protein [Bacteroidales bacterium]